jgi:subtilisin family serine protease
MRRLGSFAIGVCVVAAGALVAPVRSATLAPSSVARGHVDAWLADRLAHGRVAPTDVLRLVINADTVEHAHAAALASGVTPVVAMDRLGVVVGVGAAGAAEAVAAREGVTWVGDADRPLAPALDTSHRATRAEQARTAVTGPGGAPFGGKGVGVLIIDGGVDGTHRMFTRNGVSKVRKNLEVIPLADILVNPPVGETSGGWGLLLDPPGNNTDDVHGHGTHVAGIAAGYAVVTPEGHRLIGAAPDATLYAVSVATAGSSYYGALAAQYWATLNHRTPCGPPRADCPPIKVINNSYGPIGGSPYDPADPTNEAMHISIAEGVTWVWSAGNDGGDGSTDTTNDNAKDPTPGVLSVAAYDDGQAGNRDLALASFSSRGLSTDPSTWPDLSAPGVDIESSCRRQFVDCQLDLLFDIDPNYGRMSGTSMAAPHIAGYAALLIQAKPTITPAEIEDVLEDTAHRFTAGAPYNPDPANPSTPSSFDKGHGLVDVTAALARVLGIADPGPAPDPCLGVTVLLDKRGDATDVGLGGLLPIGVIPSDPGVDITSADVTAGATSARFRVKVADLTARPAQGSVGDYVRFSFTIGTTTYELALARDQLLGGGQAQRFILTKVTATPEGVPTSTVIANDLPGRFNPATNEASADVPLGMIHLSGAGATLGGVQVLWQRQVGVPGLGLLTLTADTAAGTCPLTVA